MKKLYISQIDTLFVNGRNPIEFLFFYKNKLKSKNIRSALKKLSSVFWPIFGEYQAGTIKFDKFSEGDVFDEVTTDQVFNPDESAEAIYDLYYTSIPPDIKKLFFLKMIQHKNGTVLIAKLKHLAGDGYSYFYLLSVLARLSCVTYLPFKKNLMLQLFKPHHNRTILKEFQFNEIDLEPVPVQEKLTLKLEEIPRTEVKDMLGEIAATLNYRISNNDILSALIIKRFMTLQREQFGENFQLTIPIDVRRNIREYGAKFIGNALMLHKINFMKHEIEQSSNAELAIKIRQSMPVIDKESFKKFLNNLEYNITERQINKLKPFDPESGGLITNLSKLPSNRLNFGTGEADFIFILTSEKNSTAILADKNNFILRFTY